MAIDGVTFRTATSADVPAMAQCRLTDPAGGRVDSRMASYFDGQHHPQHALPPRTGFLALAGDHVIAYIAGHRTTRNNCEGELQYLFVASAYRRRKVGTALVRLLAEWFGEQRVHKVCVGIAADSPPEAKPFVTRLGAMPLKTHWYAWQDIREVLGRG